MPRQRDDDAIGTSQTQPHTPTAKRRVALEETPTPRADRVEAVRSAVDNIARDAVEELADDLRAFMLEVKTRLEYGQEWMNRRETEDRALSSRIGRLLGEVEQVLGWRQRLHTLFLGVIAGILFAFLVMRLAHLDTHKLPEAFNAAQHAFTSVAFAVDHR